MKSTKITSRMKSPKENVLNFVNNTLFSLIYNFIRQHTLPSSPSLALLLPAFYEKHTHFLNQICVLFMGFVV